MEPVKAASAPALAGCLDGDTRGANKAHDPTKGSVSAALAGFSEGGGRGFLLGLEILCCVLF